MKVADYFRQTDRDRLTEALLIRSPDLNIEGILGHLDIFLETAPAKDTADLRSIRIVTSQGLDGVEFIDSFAVNNNHEEFSLSGIPWGIYGELEVYLDPEVDLKTEEVTALLLYEMTRHGSEEETQEFLHRLSKAQEDLDKEDLVEISPGVLAPRQVVEQMKELGIFEHLAKMSVKDIINAGKPIRSKPKKELE